MKTSFFPLVSSLILAKKGPETGFLGSHLFPTMLIWIDMWQIFLNLVYSVFFHVKDWTSCNSGGLFLWRGAELRCNFQLLWFSSAKRQGFKWKRTVCNHFLLLKKINGAGKILSKLFYIFTHQTDVSELTNSFTWNNFGVKIRLEKYFFPKQLTFHPPFDTLEGQRNKCKGWVKCIGRKTSFEFQMKFWINIRLGIFLKFFSVDIVSSPITNSMNEGALIVKPH